MRYVKHIKVPRGPTPVATLDISGGICDMLLRGIDLYKEHTDREPTLIRMTRTQWDDLKLNMPLVRRGILNPVGNYFNGIPVELVD